MRVGLGSGFRVEGFKAVCMEGSNNMRLGGSRMQGFGFWGKGPVQGVWVLQRVTGL